MQRSHHGAVTAPDLLPRVAVSACLLGQPVRYDGSHRRDTFISENLSTVFQLVPLCPEVEMGLGVPRPTIRLVDIKDSIHLLGVDDPSLDYTQAMSEFAGDTTEKMHVSGFILKDRSPSCGLGNTLIYDINGRRIGTGDGLFVQTIAASNSALPMITAEQLRQHQALKIFVSKVKQYAAHDRS